MKKYKLKLKMLNSETSPEVLEKKVNEWLENNDVEVVNTHMSESEYGISMAIFYYERVEDDEQSKNLNIETKTGGMIFQKEDCPSINFYSKYGLVEVETRKNNIIFSLNNVETIKYDPNECNVYYN